MKFLLQYSTRTAKDFQEVDSQDFARLPRGELPTAIHESNEKKYLHAIGAQGLDFGGFDHYDVQPLPGNGSRFAMWCDDPDDRAPLDFFAEVWEIFPLAPDPTKGGAYNTRQAWTIYAVPGSEKWNHYAATPERLRSWTLREWSAFVPPVNPIHGVWTPGDMDAELGGARNARGWRDFTEGVPDELIDEAGRLKQMKALGFEKPPQGTITNYLSDAASATGLHVADLELGLRVTPTTVQTVSVSASKTANQDRTIVWGLLGPGVADWPNGVYEFQLDCSANNGSWTYGARAVGGNTGHMAVINILGSNHRETWPQDEAVFSGTGLKGGSNTINPAAGEDIDGFELYIACNHPSGHGGGSETLEFDVNESDQFLRGPWDVTDTYTVTVNVDLHVAQRLTVPVDVDLHVAERKAVAVAVDLIVEDAPTTATVPVDVDLWVAQRLTVPVDVDVHVAERKTVPVAVDILVGGSVVAVDVDLHVAQRLTVPVDVDVHVAERKSVDVAVDLLVAERKTTPVDVDLHVAQRLTTPVDVDILVGGSVVPVAVDLHVAERKTVTVAVDIIVEDATGEITVPVDVDILVAQRLTVPVDVDVHVAGRKTATVDVDVLVGGSVVPVAVDLHVAQRLTVPVDVDVHVAERKTATVAVDIWVVGISVPVDVDLAVQPQDVFMPDGQVDNGHLGPVGAPTKIEALDDFVGSPDSADYIWWTSSGATTSTKLDTFRIWNPKDVHKTGSPKSIKVVWSQIKFSPNTFISRSALHHGNPTSDPRRFHVDSWIHATQGVWTEEVQEWPLMPAGWYGNTVERAWTWENIVDLFIGINSGSANNTEGRHRYLHAIIETLPYWVVDVCVDLHVAERKSVTVAVDLIVAEQKTVPVDVDVVVAQRLTTPVDVDLHVIGSGTATVAVDITVAQRLAATVAVDIIVSEAGLFVGTVPVDVDLLVAGRGTVPVDVDLHVAERKLATVDVDVQVVTRATVDVDVDVVVGERKAASVDVDIFVKDAHDLRPLADFDTALSVQGYAEHYKAVGGATIPGTDDTSYVFVKAGSPGAGLLDNLGAEGAIDAIRIGTITAIVMRSRALAFDSNPAQSQTQFIITMQFNGVGYSGASHDPSLPLHNRWYDFEDRLERETAVAGPNNYFQWADIPNEASRWARAFIVVAGGFSPPTESELRISEVYFHLETYREWYMREVYNFGEFPIDSPEGAGVGVVHANVDIWVHGNGKTTVAVDIWVIDPNAVSVDLELRSQVDVERALRSQVDVALDLRNAVDVDFEMESKQSESVVLKSQTDLEVDLKGVYE